MRSASSGTTGSYRNAWQPEPERSYTENTIPARRRSAVSRVFYGRKAMMLLVYSDSRFHAKVSRVKRKDGMCFWVSRQAFHVLENFFSECSDVIGGAMPFIAYRGKLGISRELVTFDSHNSEQALLISSYFNSLEKEENVSLSRMYDLLIKAWNQEISADHPVMKAFQYTRAQTVLILLDTMDVITGKTVLDNDHLFLQENGNIWRALGQASSWVQAERNYNALEEMESKLH